MKTFRKDCTYHDIRCYKYRLHGEHCFYVPELRDLDGIPFGQTRGEHLGYVKVTAVPDPSIWFASGYAWDGCSGPTIDDETNHVAGLVHDGLYQLMRQCVLPQSARKIADKIFHRLCLDYGMGRLRAWYYYQAVHRFAAAAARVRLDPRTQLRCIKPPKSG